MALIKTEMNFPPTGVNKLSKSLIADWSIEYIKDFLARGGDINIRDSQGKTLLMYCIPFGNEEIFRFLIDNGADVNAKDKDKRTVLMYALEDFNNTAAKILIDNGADVNARCKFGKTTLMHKYRHWDDRKLAKILIDNGADVNARCKFEETELMHAVKSGDEEAVEALIEAGADVNARCKFKETALMKMIGYSKNIAKSLIEAGADVNAKNHCGDTVLGKIWYMGNKETIEYLIDAGYPIKNKKYGDFAIVKAATYKDILELLIRKGANVNGQGLCGDTALIKAAGYNAIDSINFLLEVGADVNIKNTHGHTALSESKRMGRKEAVDILEKHSSKYINKPHMIIGKS